MVTAFSLVLCVNVTHIKSFLPICQSKSYNRDYFPETTAFSRNQNQRTPQTPLLFCKYSNEIEKFPRKLAKNVDFNLTDWCSSLPCYENKNHKIIQMSKINSHVNYNSHWQTKFSFFIFFFYLYIIVVVTPTTFLFTIIRKIVPQQCWV